MRSSILDQIKGHLVVSCQALPEEPLHSPFIMGKMAYAAMLGGAKGIRANSVEDIKEIKQAVDLPIIGIIKQVYDDSGVFITPTFKEVNALVEEGVDMIALDATKRRRPDGKTLKEMFGELKTAFPDQLFMADCSTFEEAIYAEKIGFDCVSTTLNGYTTYTQGETLPNFQLLSQVIEHANVPVILEGGVWETDDVETALKLGAHSVVVGTAITRPMEITKRFVAKTKVHINSR